MERLGRTPAHGTRRNVMTVVLETGKEAIGNVGCKKLWGDGYANSTTSAFVLPWQYDIPAGARRHGIEPSARYVKIWVLEFVVHLSRLHTGIDNKSSSYTLVLLVQSDTRLFHHDLTHYLYNLDAGFDGPTVVISLYNSLLFNVSITSWTYVSNTYVVKKSA